MEVSLAHEVVTHDGVLIIDLQTKRKQWEVEVEINLLVPDRVQSLLDTAGLVKQLPVLRTHLVRERTLLWTHYERVSTEDIEGMTTTWNILT